MKRESTSTDDLATALRDTARMERAIAAAQAGAVRRHHLLGQSVVVWQNGRVVEIPPPAPPSAGTDAG